MAWLIGVIAGVFIIPFVLGSFLAKSLRMPTYSFPIGIILAVVFGATAIVTLGKPRYGVDIKGGTILVYELDRSVQGTKEDGSGLNRVKASALVDALTQRINPTGTKEIIIRPYGEDQIEIIVPDVDQQEVDEIKRTVQAAGILKFRIVANQVDHAKVFELARNQAASEDLKVRLNSEVKDAQSTTIALWQTIGRDKDKVQGIRPLLSPAYSGDLIRDSRTGKIVQPPTDLDRDNFGLEKWLDQNGIAEVDLLLALNGPNGQPYELVTGDDLAMVAKDTGADGAPEVTFQMNAAGAQRLLRLTGRNVPTNDFHRRMAIILDGRVLSAPNLNSPIRDRGVIQGRFTQKEVNFLVNILESGSLPAALGKEPISESQIGAVLGQQTIQKGYFASALSLVVTFVFLLVYYRFSGIIACIALMLNMLLLYASILLIQQPITLPGLAGFVLSVGMSVDANVLVYERIREEVARRATGRMAIRNGFDNAMTTIVDSNLTTLISAIVLYAAGTDQVKGFAVPLIIGIIISMFTAVYCSRILFDIAEKLRLANFGMMDAIGWAKKSFLGEKDIDFMGMRNMCYTFSGILLVGGLIAVAIRGKDMLDIDFNGGSSVVFSLDKPMEIDQIRDLTKVMFDKDEKSEPIQTSLTTMTVPGLENNTVFRLDSSLTDVKEVASRLVKGFEKESSKLITFEVAASDWKETAAVQDKPAATNAVLSFSSSKGGVTAKITASRLKEKLAAAASTVGQGLNAAQLDVFPQPMVEGWTEESQAGFPTWQIKLPYPQDLSTQIVNQLQKDMVSEPVWQSTNKIGERVAGQMQFKAIASIVLSLIFINLYIWFRFHSPAYGIAAVIALLHDVIITLGLMALSHWLYGPLSFLQLEDFKVGLTVVAAFLTIIGYSLNDTIVVFDRIREVKGKSPNLTRSMINKSVNETLGRTLLTSSTTIIAILLLYFLGGEGIHAFSFALFFGILTGTYSSIFVAAPVLLWLVGREERRDSVASSTTSAMARQS